MNDPATLLSNELQLMEPDPIGYSFSAPGWQLLAAVLLLLVLFMALKGVIRYRKNAYRRAALKRVRELQSRPAPHPVFALNRVLKEVALEQFDRASVASLHGPDWLRFLANSAPGLAVPPELWQEHYMDSLYGWKPMNEADWGHQVDLATHWIKKHDARKF